MIDKNTKHIRGSDKWIEDWRCVFLERVRTGLRSLESICIDKDMPSKVFVYGLLKGDVNFANDYARAREARGDHLLEEMIEIADDSTNDFMKRKHADGRIDEVPNHENISRSKLRVESRKWAASKMAPKTLGDRVALDVAVTEETMTEDQQIERIKGLIPQIAPILIGLGWTAPDEP